MILKLGMQHQGLNVYKDTGLTLTYCTTRFYLSSICLNGENLQSHIMETNCSKGLNCIIMIKMTTGGCLSAPAPGLYTYIWPLFSNISSETA